MKNVRSTKSSSIIQIAFAAIFALLLAFYSVKHLPVSIISFTLKNIPPQKDSLLSDTNGNYVESLLETILLAKKASLKEKDNSEYYLKLAEFYLDAFHLEDDKKKSILQSFVPSSVITDFEDALMIKVIYELLYSSLHYNPSNSRPFLHLTQLSQMSLNTGKRYIDSKMIKEAQSLSSHYIERALTLNPSNSQLNYAAGKCFILIGESEKAALRFRKALELNKNLSNSIFSETFYEKDKNTIINIILENEPISQILYGDFLISHKNYDEAEGYYKGGFDLSAEKIEPYQKLCQLYFDVGKIEEVKIISERMLKEGYTDTSEGRSEVFYNISRYYEAIEDFSAGIEFAQKAVETNKVEIRNLYLLAKLYLRNGEIERAISQLKFILTNFNREANRAILRDTHFLMGEAYERNDDIVKAYKEYNKALKLDPHNKKIQKRINFLMKGLR